MESTKPNLKLHLWFRFLAVLFGFALFLNSLIIAEFILGRMNWAPSVGIVDAFSARYSESKPYIGEAILPNLKNVERLRMREDHFIFRYFMNSDSHGRRVSSSRNIQYPEAAIFFGCSFTEGMGVEDFETLPSQFAQAQSRYRAYNYGMSGYGAQQMLAKLEGREIKQEIPEKVTLGIYVYMHDHYRRVLGATGRIRKMPYYKSSPDGPVYAGLFTEERPITSFIYGVLDKSEIFKYFHGELPIFINNQDKDLFCSVVKKSRDLFIQQFPQGQFYVLMYDNYQDQDPKLEADLKRCGEKFGIPILNFNPLQKKEYAIPEDGHPNAVGNKAVAEWIASQIIKN